MADAATDPAEADTKGGKGGKLKPLLLGIVLALAGAGGGYFAATSGLLGGGEGKPEGPTGVIPSAFVDVTPMIVSIARQGGISQLRLKLSLEVEETAAGDVAAAMPRILDVLNSYLRALDTVDIGDPAMLVRLRAQMLRRVQIVVGGDAVKDLLVQEFVVN